MTTLTVQDMMKMNKSNLIDQIVRLQAKEKNMPVKTAGRKEQVLECLRNGITSIDKIAESLGINNKNVSSQLCYLRKDGHMIYSIRINGNTTMKLEE